MDLAKMRGELAAVLGWNPYTASNKVVVWQHGEPGVDYEHQLEHPIPATLDGIAAIWKEHAKGWEWSRHRGWWLSHKTGTPDGGTNNTRVPDTGHELHDRTALLLSVLKSQGATR